MNDAVMVHLLNRERKYAIYLVIVHFFAQKEVGGMPENKFDTPEMLARCVPMSRLQGVLGGKWKIMILWYITAYRVQRFGELQRRLDGVTQSSLTKSLRELERDGFLHREIYQEIPPRVEYTLTEMGQSFAPILHSMLAWSEAHLPPERREDANI